MSRGLSEKGRRGRGRDERVSIYVCTSALLLLLHALTEEDILEHTSKSQCQTACGANEEYGSYIESECDSSVCEEDKWTELSKVKEGCESFCEWNQASVDGCTDWSKVVEGNQWVHLESLKQDLHHDETR